MSISCGYIVNEEPLYLLMTAYSLSSLRKYSDAPVSVFLIHDNKQSSKKKADTVFSRIKTPLVHDVDSFLNYCKQLNVNVLEKPIPSLRGEENYWAAHRWYFRELKVDSFLLLDADTVLFDDVKKIFNFYSNYDMVADVNNWGKYNKVNNVVPFNSGVMIFNSGWHQKWAEKVPQYCYDLYNKIHPMAEWFWGVSTKDCSGREELAATLFALDNNLNYGYFLPEHVQTERKNNDCIIFHTLSQNWIKLFI